MQRNNSGRWAALAVVALSVILTLSTWFSATAVTPDLVQAWGLSLDQAGWLTNAVQLGFVSGAILSSLLALGDVLRLQQMMAVSAVIAALANAALLLEPGIGGAVAARIVNGAALACIYPPAMKYVATWFRSQRGLALGIMVGALVLGSAAPHFLRALGTGFPWEAVIWVSSLACLLSAGINFWALPDGPYPFASARIDPRQVRHILRNRPAMLANLGYFGHMWELYAMWGWLLAYASAAIAAGNPVFQGNASLLVFAVIALGAPGCVLGGLLSDRIGRCLTTALMLAVSGSCALLIGIFFNGPAWLFALVVLLWGLTVAADSAQFSTAVTELSDPKYVGSMLAFQTGAGFAITVFTIWFVPQVAGWLGGWRWSFLVLAPGPALGILAMLRLRRHPDAVKLSGGRR